METINDKWIRIGGVALLSMNLLFLGVGQRDLTEEVIYIVIYLASVILILETGRFIILYRHRRYSERSKRVVFFWKTCLFVFTSYFTLFFSPFICPILFVVCIPVIRQLFSYQFLLEALY